MPLNWAEDDEGRAAWLHAHGDSTHREHITVWFPSDSIDSGHLDALVDSLDKGIGELKTLIGGTLPWQRLGSDRIVYYFVPGVFISHVNVENMAVFIPLLRIREGPAPYLHEAMHVLLTPHSPYYAWEFADSSDQRQAYANWHSWLLEGLPEYAARLVAGSLAFREGDVFRSGGPALVDSTCALRSSTGRGTEVLDHVGRASRPSFLFTTERREVAPIFYPCSYSFTKFLVEETDAPFVASLFPAMPLGGIDRLIRERTGSSLADLREEWLRRIRK